MDHIIDTKVSTTTDGITTTPGRPLTTPMKKEIKQTTSSMNVTQTLSRRDNADTSVDAIQQYVRDTLLESSTEKVDLEFTEDGIETIANLATEINSSIENIGARRLHTIIEKVLDEISFTATDRSGEKVTIDKNFVSKNLGELAKDTDLSKFIL